MSKVGRNSWTAIERSKVVEGPNYKKQRNIKNKLARNNKAIDAAWLEARKAWVFLPPENMVVTLHNDTGSFPASLILSVPQCFGAFILLKKLGRIIESNDVAVDAVIEGSYEDAVEALGFA